MDGSRRTLRPSAPPDVAQSCPTRSVEANSQVPTDTNDLSFLSSPSGIVEPLLILLKKTSDFYQFLTHYQHWAALLKMPAHWLVIVCSQDTSWTVLWASLVWCTCSLRQQLQPTRAYSLTMTFTWGYSEGKIHHLLIHSRIPSCPRCYTQIHAKIITSAWDN